MAYPEDDKDPPYVDPPTPTGPRFTDPMRLTADSPPPQPAARSAGDLSAINQQYGFPVDASDTQAYIDNRLSLDEITQRMVRRAGPTSHRTVDSQSVEGNALYGSGTGNASNTPGGPMGTAAPSARPQSYPPFSNTNPQFDDPASRLLEDYSLDRFRQRTNPDPNSGTALYEKYARELVDTLKQPVYSAGDESIIKGRAFDAIELERGQTKQQWLQELSRRGIQPSSGIALDGLRKIDSHYEGLRTTVHSQFAQNAIDQTRQQRTQVLDTYGQLANSEEGRMREALTYASLPYELQNNAFQRNLQLVGAAGNPSSLLNSALSAFQVGNNANIQQSQQQQQSINAIMQYIAYTLGGGR